MGKGKGRGAAKAAFWLAVIASTTGCEVLDDILGGGDGDDPLIQGPTGELVSVQLASAPNVLQVLAWQCDELDLGLACLAIGPRPTSDQLAFEFDLNFDIENPNLTIPIPLVETLLGITVFDTTNLGAVCISLCDPEDTSCEAQADQAGACDVEGSPEVLGPDDLVPTVPGLVSLIRGAGDGTYVNDQWRLLLAGDTTRVTFNFQLAPQGLLELGENLITDALEDLQGANVPELEIPFTTEGTLFFDVPSVGKRSVGFGPFADRWMLEVPEL